MYRKCAVILSIFSALFGCLFWPPKTFVEAEVHLNGRNNVVFNYYNAIRSERTFRSDDYLFRGITVKEETCPLAKCVRIIWEVNNGAVYDENAWDQDRRLPDFITYGQEFSGATVEFDPERLALNTPYFVRVGILGVDDDQEHKIYFSAETFFLLKKDKRGKLQVERALTRSTLIKWQEEFLRLQEDKQIDGVSICGIPTNFWKLSELFRSFYEVGLNITSRSASSRCIEATCKHREH